MHFKATVSPIIFQTTALAFPSNSVPDIQEIKFETLCKVEIKYYRFYTHIMLFNPNNVFLLFIGSKLKL